MNKGIFTVFYKKKNGDIYSWHFGECEQGYDFFGDLAEEFEVFIGIAVFEVSSDIIDKIGLLKIDLETRNLVLKENPLGEIQEISKGVVSDGTTTDN